MLNRRLMILNLTTCTRCAGSPKVAGSVIKCPMDGGAILAHAQTGDCPKGVLSVTGGEHPPAAPDMAWGPSVWKLLHTAEKPDEALIRRVTASIPCGECKQEWLSILKDTPPVFDERWFTWAVEKAHNRVNAKLGKPTMTVEAARLKWLVD